VRQALREALGRKASPAANQDGGGIFVSLARRISADGRDGFFVYESNQLAPAVAVFRVELAPHAAQLCAKSARSAAVELVARLGGAVGRLDDGLRGEASEADFENASAEIENALASSHRGTNGALACSKTFVSEVLGAAHEIDAWRSELRRSALQPRTPLRSEHRCDVSLAAVAHVHRVVAAHVQLELAKSLLNLRRRWRVAVAPRGVEIAFGRYVEDVAQSCFLSGALAPCASLLFALCELSKAFVSAHRAALNDLAPDDFRQALEHWAAFKFHVHRLLCFLRGGKQSNVQHLEAQLDVEFFKSKPACVS